MYEYVDNCDFPKTQLISYCISVLKCSVTVTFLIKRGESRPPEVLNGIDLKEIGTERKLCPERKDIPQPVNRVNTSQNLQRWGSERGTLNIQYLGRYSLFETYFLRKISRLRSFTSYMAHKKELGFWTVVMFSKVYWVLIPSKNLDYGHKSKVYRYILYRILIILQNATVRIIMSYYYKCLFIKKLPNL